MIKNENGEILGAKASSISIAENSFSVEEKTIVSIMIFALEMGFTNVEFERDALAVIKKMQGGQADFQPSRTILRKPKKEYPHSKIVSLNMLVVKAIRQ